MNVMKQNETKKSTDICFSNFYKSRKSRIENIESIWFGINVILQAFVEICSIQVMMLPSGHTVKKKR